MNYPKYSEPPNDTAMKSVGRTERYLLYATYAKQRAEEHFEANPDMTASCLLIALSGDVAEAQGMILDALREENQ